MASAPDSVERDVDDFQHAADRKARTKTLRLAVLLIKIVAVLYFVVGAGTAISDFDKASDRYERDLAFYNQVSSSNPYATAPEKPLLTGVIVVLLRDALVAFFGWVSAEVIKLQLSIAEDTALLRTRSDVGAREPSPRRAPAPRAADES
jgi:hypothetical protein